LVNADLVAAKLADLASRVARARKSCPATLSALAANSDALDLVSFNLMLAVQICADIASHLIADEGWPAANTLADGFRRLSQQGVVSSETAEALCKAVGLRNVVVHGYSRVNPDLVFAAATRGIDDLDAFAREVSQWILSRQT
jgi:uncharacterized protein YutE (UPF0331/DUF86 family)